jgi:hypothetical protein
MVDWCSIRTPPLLYYQEYKQCLKSFKKIEISRKPAR